MQLRLLAVMLILNFSALPVFSQRDTAAFYKSINVRLHYGFIIAHSQAVQNTAGAHPRGIEMELVKQRTDTTAWDLCHCYPVKGWSFSYFDFNNNVLGHGINVAYFLEPAYRMGQRSQFRFRGSVGLSYLSNPYNAESNATNMSYSSNISGYLQLGMSWNYLVTKQWLLQLGAHYQHVSNGGLKDPNKGINWPTASIGVNYYRRPYRLLVYKKRNEKSKAERKPYVEAGLFTSAKQGFQQGGGSARTPLVGVLLQGEKQVGHISALNAGVEVYFDNALRQQLQKDSITGSAYRVGLLAGHNFLLGKFFFSQQLGIYLFKQAPYYDRIYHRWSFRYKLYNNWMVGFGLNAHRHVADFIDIRVTYRFSK